MNDRPVHAWLADARYYANQAHQIGRTFDRNASNDRDYLAIRYCLTVVGEALNEVSEDVLADAPDIPWRQIIALRHRLVHGYWLIDMDIILQIAHNETEPLATALNRLIEKFE